MLGIPLSKPDKGGDRANSSDRHDSAVSSSCDWAVTASGGSDSSSTSGTLAVDTFLHLAVSSSLPDPWDTCHNVL